MARVTVEDCLEREENRFALVILASRRTRQLMKGANALVHSKNKASVTALRGLGVHGHGSTIVCGKLFWQWPLPK